jgi:hypothetical protein
MATMKKLIFAVLATLAFSAAGTIPARAATSKPIIWRPLDRAILEVTGRKPPKVWNIWEDEKQKTRVLVQLDNLYLMLDAKTKQVFEISAAKLQQHGKNFESADPSETQHAVPSTDWDMRDLGPAERIEVRLDDNTMLNVQLPHPLDLRTPLH